MWKEEEITTSNISLVLVSLIKLLHRCFINHRTNEQEKERTVPCPKNMTFNCHGLLLYRCPTFCVGECIQL